MAARDTPGGRMVVTLKKVKVGRSETPRTIYYMGVLQSSRSQTSFSKPLSSISTFCSFNIFRQVLFASNFSLLNIFTFSHFFPTPLPPPTSSQHHILPRSFAIIPKLCAGYQWNHKDVSGCFKFSWKSQQPLSETTSLRSFTVSTLHYYTSFSDPIFSKLGFQ